MISSGSVERVRRAAEAAGLVIEIRRMAGSTRTAEEAAAQCGCAVAQIVKSLVFQTASGSLVLFLVAGDRRLDTALAEHAVGEALARADPRLVREKTGFAIGGVAPLGHLATMPVHADRSLLAHAQVWAAAGAPDRVFGVEPQALVAATGAIVGDIAA